MTGNNTLAYVFTTAKLDATCQRWLVELSNHNWTISYRSGKQNLDADRLSRIPETETSVTLIPDVLKAVCSSISMEHQPERFNKTLLNLMATFPEVRKTDWNAHVSTLTHANNAAVHDYTRFVPYYLMFGWHPRFAIDAFLGIPSYKKANKIKVIS